MANLTTTELNKTVKETFDAVIQESFADNMPTLKRFKRSVPTEDITSVGRYFAIQVQSNESYGSPTEGGAFPAAGKLVDVKALVNYRSQFKSFAFTGDVQDLAGSKTLQNMLTRIIKDSTQVFDRTQGFFLFGSGDGVLGVIASVSSNALTMANTVANPFGARGVNAGMLLNAYDQSGTAYRTGDMNVSSVTRATDIVNVDAAAGSIASDSDDVLVYKSAYNTAAQGLKYHVNDDTGTWLGLSRSTYPNLRAIVHDASSASIDFDMIEIADLKSRNITGDDSPKFGKVLIMHPVQHKNLRAIARSQGNVQFQTSIAGTPKMDLLVKDVAPAGQEIIEDSNCGPSDVFGLRLDDWAIEEVAPRQLYKHNDGNVFIQQIASSTAYGDAKEGRIYWRYNYVCKSPYTQYRIKNVNFSTAETRVNRM